MTDINLPSSVSDAISSGDLDRILATTIEHFGCQAGTIHLLNDGQLQLAAHQGLPPQVTAIVQTVPIGKGIAGLAAERREPITICNLQTDNSGQARPGARATGMEGSIAVPMLSAEGRELRGVFGIAKSEAHDWTGDEKAVLQAIANRCVNTHKPVMKSDLEAEAARATEMLRGRAVKQVWRHRSGEIGLEFEDGTRLFVDSSSALELSITGLMDE